MVVIVVAVGMAVGCSSSEDAGKTDTTAVPRRSPTPFARNTPVPSDVVIGQITRLQLKAKDLMNAIRNAREGKDRFDPRYPFSLHCNPGAYAPLEGRRLWPARYLYLSDAYQDVCQQVLSAPGANPRELAPVLEGKLGPAYDAVAADAYQTIVAEVQALAGP